MSKNNNADIDVLNQAVQILKAKKKSFIKILAVTFVLSCLIIFPQPRYYTSEVKLAPEYGSRCSPGAHFHSFRARSRALRPGRREPPRVSCRSSGSPVPRPFAAVPRPCPRTAHRCLAWFSFFRFFRSLQIWS